MNYILVVVLWSAIALVVLLTAIYRKMIANQQDYVLHLHEGESNIVKHQASVARKLETIDRFGKSATIFVVTGGLVIAAFFLINAWLQGGKLQ